MKNVSIVIPCHGTENLLPLLNSISKQTFRDFEIIILDSKFNKNKRNKIIKKFKNLNIKYIFHENPVSKKRNTASKLAKGRWIVFIDDDTILPKNWLKELWKKKRRDAVVVGSQVKPELGDFGETEMTETCNVILPRKIMEKVKFNENWKYAAFEDKDWCFRVREKGYKLIRVPSAIIYHKPHKRFKLIKKEFEMGMEAAKFQKYWGYKSKFKLWRNTGSRFFILLGNFAHLLGIGYGIFKYYILRRR